MNAGIVNKFKLVFASCACAGFLTTSAVGPAHAAAQDLTQSLPMRVGNYISPFGHYLAAFHAEREENYSLAADLLSVTRMRDDNNAFLQDNQHQWLVTEGRYVDAVSLAENLLKVSPDSIFGQRTLFVDAVSRNDWKAAKSFLPPFPEQGLDAYLIPLQTAWMAAYEGDHKAALEALQRFREEPSLEPIGIITEALLHEQAGNNQQAIDFYDKAMNLYEIPPERLVALAGNLFERTDQGKRAQELYASFLAQSPRNHHIQARLEAAVEGKTATPLISGPRAGLAEGAYALARVIYRDKLDPVALTLANIALHLSPSEPAYVLLAGRMLTGQKRYNDALVLYESINADSLAYYSTQLIKSNNLSDAGRFEEAITLLKDLAKTEPERADALVQLGNILRRNERNKEAAEAYDNAVNRTSDPSELGWRTYYFRGIAHEQSGDWPAAEASLQQALALNPDQPLLLNYLGYSWADMKINLVEALDMLNRAIDSRPNDGYIVDSLGWVLFQLGRVEEALPLLEKAVEILPGDPVINDHVGDAYWLVGRKREARYQWRRALSFDPVEKDEKAINAKLENGYPNETAEK